MNLTSATGGKLIGTGYAGTSKNLLPDNGTNVRASNSVTYTSPTLYGTSV